MGNEKIPRSTYKPKALLGRSSGSELDKEHLSSPQCYFTTQDYYGERVPILRIQELLICLNIWIFIGVAQFFALLA
jgi:hypothetical protein